MATRDDPQAAVTSWLRRTTEIHDELAAVADIERWWWLLAGGIAMAEPYARDDVYLATDAEPDGDTFMAFRAPAPHDLVTDAIARARAARAALQEIDGTLPDQPLAVTIDHSRGAGTHPCRLDTAAFAVGAHCLVARLDDESLPVQLARVLAGHAPPRWTGETPFVCVTLGEEPIETVRHNHRRAWTKHGGPWLGLSRARGMSVVSTCHLVVDGYGHARIAAAIGGQVPLHHLRAAPQHTSGEVVPDPVPSAIPLSVAWRELGTTHPRVIPLAYELGRILHRQAGVRAARFSPTIQVPVARGDKDDPHRLHRRVVSATISVRFDRGQPEPFEIFEARVRDVFAREAAGAGLVSRMLAAARAVPVPLAWKRKGIGAKRPPWLERIAELIGGRALVSRIAVDVPVPVMCAVSSPSRLASARDPVGGCVLTIVDDGTTGAITLSGSGAIADSAILDELLDADAVSGVA